jgi:hypothetical protein
MLSAPSFSLDAHATFPPFSRFIGRWTQQLLFPSKPLVKIMSLPQHILLQTTFTLPYADEPTYKHVLHSDHAMYCYNRFTNDGVGWQTHSFASFEKALHFFLKQVRLDRKTITGRNLEILPPATMEEK